MSSIISSFISPTQIYIVNLELSYQLRFMSSIMSSFISSSQSYAVNYLVIYIINLELCRQLRIISSSKSNLCRQLCLHLSHQLRFMS